MIKLKFNVMSLDDMFEIVAKIKNKLFEMEICEEVIKRVQTVAFEGITNGIIHAGGVSIEIVFFDNLLRITFIDKGNGIENISKAFVRGFSTAGLEYKSKGFGAGMGLDNIIKNADSIYIATKQKVGTEISVDIGFENTKTSWVVKR